MSEIHYAPAEGLRILPFDARGGESFLVEAEGQRRWQVNGETADLLRLLQSGTSLEEAAHTLAASWGRPIAPAELGREIDRTLVPAGMVVRPGEPLRAPERPRGRSGALSLRFTLLPARWISPFGRLLAPLFSPAHFWLGMLAVVSAAIWAAALGGAFAYAPLLFSAPVLGLTLLSTAFHELGHAAACRRFGCDHGDMGFGLYLVFPVLYMDVDEAWRLPREQRAVVDAGGVYLQLLFALSLAAAGLLWPSFRPYALGTLALVLLLVLANLNPLFRFDGYWLLSDLAGVPNLRRRSMTALGRWLRREPAAGELSRRAMLFLGGYGVVSLAFFGYYFGRILLRLPQYVGADYPYLVARTAALIHEALGRGEPLRAVFLTGGLILPTLLLIGLLLIPLQWLRPLLRRRAA